MLLNLLHFFTYYTNMSSVLFEGETLLVAELAKIDLDKIRYECNIINIFIKEVNLFSSKTSILYLVYFFPPFFQGAVFLL